jgi:drug/metabolite transporter (DMT)-like permease
MGFQLAALASLSFVLLDILRKVLGRRLPPVQVVVGLNCGAAVVFATALAADGVPPMDMVFVAVALVEVVTFALSSVLYVQAVALSPLTLTVPYLALTPVVSALVAAAVLGEMPGWQGWAGITLTVFGALLLHLDPGITLGRLLRAPFREPGSRRMMAVALIWGMTTSLDKIAIRHGSEALLGLWLSLGGALLLAALRQVDRTLGDLPHIVFQVQRPAFREPLLYLASLISAIAVLCQYFAYQELMVAYVETVKRAGGLLSALAGLTLFGERGSAFRLPAAALMILGLLLLVFQADP